MRTSIALLRALLFDVIECDKTQDARLRAPEPPLECSAAPIVAPPAPLAGRKLFLDMHDMGPRKGTADAAAGAHQRDLATQGKYGVDFKAYWVDEKAGKIYCLIEAPSADAALAVHKEAHGLMPQSIEEVSAGH